MWSKELIWTFSEWSFCCSFKTKSGLELYFSYIKEKGRGDYMRSKSEQQSVQIPGWAPSGSNSLFVTIRDSQSLSLGENLVTSHSFEMRKLFFSCLTSEQGDLRKGCESYWGFTSQWGVIHSQHCSDVPFNPLTPEPEWLGHLLPTSGGRALYCRSCSHFLLNFLSSKDSPEHYSYTCPGHTPHPSTEQRGSKGSLGVIPSEG